MTTATSIHSRSITPALSAPQEIEGTVRGLQAWLPGQPRRGPAPAEDVGRPPRRRSPERERPEDDEAVVIAVPATVTHRSLRERPEDDEVILTYTIEPACRRVG